MRRYIDADLLKDKTTRVNNIWNRTTNAEGKGLDEIIDDIPTADVVEVVRCEQCRHFEAINNDDHGWCKLISDLPCEMSVRYDDDFCSYGERADT